MTDIRQWLAGLGLSEYAEAFTLRESAAQAVAVSRTLLGAWTPDLGLLLVVAFAGAFRRSDVLVATGIVGLARVAHSIEPPAALLASGARVEVVPNESGFLCVARSVPGRQGALGAARTSRW